MLVLSALWPRRPRRGPRPRPAGVVSLGRDNPVVAARLDRLEACERQLAECMARIEEFNQAWAAMGPLRDAGFGDGRRHGLHAVPRELPG